MEKIGPDKVFQFIWNVFWVGYRNLYLVLSVNRQNQSMNFKVILQSQGHFEQNTLVGF